jgi:prevent-host-death family protein
LNTAFTGKRRDAWTTIDFQVADLHNLSMTQVSVDEIEQDLPAFLQRVQAGEAFVITQSGKPLAEITPIASDAKTARPFGLAAGDFVVPDDFDGQLPESILQEFEG